MVVALRLRSVATIFDTGSRKLELVRSSEERPTGRITAVVLAGERTWRHDSLESLGPRALLRVGDRPLVSHAIGWLNDASVAATVCSNGDAERLRRSLRSFHDARRVTFFDDDSPRGPSGCVADVLGDALSELIVVVEGSVIPTLDFRRLVRTHSSSHAMATVVVQPKHGHGADAGLPDVPAGIYIFNRDAFNHVPSTGYQDIKEGLLRRLYEAGATIRVHEATEWCPRVIDSRSYLAASQWAIRRLAQQRGSALLADPSARIADGAVLIGPVLIGANAVVSEGASVIGPACIGSDSLVHQHAVVSRAMVGERCTVGTGALVDQTVLADGVTVQDGDTVIEMVRMQSPAAPKAAPRRWLWPARAAHDVVAVGTMD